MTKPSRIGRPPKAEADKYRTPQRGLGRMSAEDWDAITQAAARSGKTKTAWMSDVLLRAARRTR